MTTGQKRKLGTAACVGLMIEFADPNGGDKAKKSFVANVSLNKDKNAEATTAFLALLLSISNQRDIGRS